MIEPEPLQQIDRTYVRFRRRKLSYFSGCDYFRLASHPRVLTALNRGASRYGLNVAASRLTTGNHALYAQLEQRLARFFAAQSALLVASGYQSNLAAAQGLAGEFSHVLLDEKAHPSLADAARFLDCPVLQFRHHDAGAVAQAVQRCGPGARQILLTDGLFAVEGTVAPLDQYLKILPKDALLLVDDAHGAGVIGQTGKGSLEYCGVNRKRVLQTVTLSKAFGVFGGAILGPARLRQRIVERSRLFLGSTPLPLPLVCAALEAVQILERSPELRERLFQKVQFVREALGKGGMNIAYTPGPIIALRPENTREALKLKRKLLAAGVYPPFIRYPGGPTEGSFRFVISSEHTDRQLRQLVKALTPN